MSDTLISDLIHLPDSVSRGDFVLNLDSGVRDADATIGQYVVTPQLVQHFDAALKLVHGAINTRKSRGTYLDGSFGSGKSHFMAVLNFLLAGNMQARTIAKLAPVVTAHDGWMQSKRFLMIPYHMIGAISLESAVLGGYVRHVRERHPEAPTPAVFRAKAWMDNAVHLRAEMGDASFFRRLNAGKASEESADWGALGGTWDAASFDRAVAAGPDDDDYRRLSSDVIDTFFQAVRKEGDYVSLDEGLAVMSAHAKELGYDALILFLDEMILWLASNASNVDFISREVPKVSKLVESQHSVRPIPIVSFIARQRDLRELIGDHVMGSQSLNFADQLKYWEGRFGTIKLEDANLPFIAEERVLKAKDAGAKLAIDEEFKRTTQVREAVMNVLLTRHSNRDAFRRLYPFSPALVETLVAVSSLLQRERTALKIMLQLLVDQKNTLRLGELVPVGDLYDEIAQGDEAFSTDMERHFKTADQLYRRHLKPMLEETHGLSFEAAEKLDYRDAQRVALRTDDRLVKTLLLAALAPEVESLKNLTPERLAALNHGTIKSPIPGQEASIVLNKLRTFAGRCGQIKIQEGAAQPVVSIQLSGVDVEAILDRAMDRDNFGNRIRLLKDKLYAILGFQSGEKLWLEHKVQWRGTQRSCKVYFQNVREAENDALDNQEDEWKIVIDYPIDQPGHGPQDDIARLDKFRSEKGSARTLVWLPSALSQAAQDQLGKLVRLEHILEENRFRSFVQDLSSQDQESAKSILRNLRDAQHNALISQLTTAYGLNFQGNSGATDPDKTLRVEDHFQSLDTRLQLQVPAASQLKPAFDELLQQAISSQYPGHPHFDRDLRLTKGAVEKVLAVISDNLRSKEHRTAVDKADRSIVRQIAQPLRMGEMGETHFVMGEHWKDHLNRSAAKAGSTDGMTVRELRQWMDDPEPMGLPVLLQDLIILTYAQQTNRSFTLHGATCAVSLNDIPDDCSLRLQELPSEEAWARAVELAYTVLGTVQLPTFVSGQNVVVFSEKVKASEKELSQVAKQLLPELLNRAAEFNCSNPEQAPRIMAAREAKTFLGIVNRESHARLVESLAQLELTSPPEALASSLKSAQKLLNDLPHLDLKAIAAAASLQGERGREGARLREELFHAFAQNEYAVAFLPTYQRVHRRAIELMAAELQQTSSHGSTGETGAGSAGSDPGTLKVVVPPKRKGTSNRSQVTGDRPPEGLAAQHVPTILTHVNVPTAKGTQSLWVSRNLQALIDADPNALYDEDSGLLKLPAFDWEGAIAADE